MNPFIPIPVYQDDYQTPEERALEDEVDRFEKELIEDAHDLNEKPILALAEYLASASIDAEILECLSSVIDHAVNAPFCERHNSINRIINSALRWKAEQLAKQFLS